ncbi:MAG: enoyl-CoA hydratase [Pseudomonadota bacterium]
MPETIKVTIEQKIALITLNRPKALNALCAKLMAELEAALDALEADDGVNVIVLTGSERAFAAGGDIREMADQSYMDVYKSDFITSQWERLTRCRKPVIAAIAGYAIGGGCELAMMCDMIIAADNAQFSQPEITIGTIPGSGGTQRLTKAIGKAKAMELCLTGRFMDAHEAERAGLVTRVVPLDQLMDETMKLAQTIAAMSKPIAMMVKEAINQAFETNLREGIHFERRLFHATFATRDQHEGMHAFIEKRKASWHDE